MELEEIQKILLETNVNEHTETKDDLTYLSWAWAWQEFLKVCPNATYEIKKFQNPITGKMTPYLEDDFGIMVFTSITVNGLTREMWLPVMDGKNKAMKRESYTYTTKFGEKTVDAATMFDVNKAIMRCLTKNIAMFGLGIYIYAGEDLPQEPKCTDEQVLKMRELQVNETNVCLKFKVKTIEDLTESQANVVIKMKEGK